ncbi:hypothetical protein D3C83_33970 [compost metagenome]
MRTWSRRRLSSIAVVLLIAIGALSLPHGAEPGHEPEFAGFVAGDGTDGVVTPESSDEGQELHCLACHWARAFRPVVETGFLAQPIDNTRMARHVRAEQGRRSSPASQPSLRAPPVASLPSLHA